MIDETITRTQDSTLPFRKWEPYLAYKDSKVEWLGHIPAHWELKRLKNGFEVRLGKMLQPEPGTDNDTLEPYLRAANVFWEGIDVSDIKEMWFSPYEKSLYRIESGDLIVCEGGDVGRSALWNGKIYPCYIQNAVHRVRAKVNYSNKFLYYWMILLKTEGYIDLICSKATIAHLTAIKLNDLPLLHPPIDEQANIIGYLDKEISKVNALVVKKERQIELLQEKRTALISQALTEGLDPTVPLKDSGIPWLGKIPTYWQVMAFKRLGSFQAGAGFPDEEQGFTDEELPFYKVSDTNLQGNELFMLVHNNSITRDTAKKLRAFVLPPETIIFAKVGAALLLNKRRILTQESCIDNNMMGFMRKNCNLKWAYYWMCGLDLGRLANPGAVPSINEGQIREVPVPVPPFAEQRRIADSLERETGKIDALISKVREGIDKLKEYRTALISAAVTGKIDLREEAGHA